MLAPTSPIRRTPSVRRNPTAPRDVLPDRGDVLAPFGAARRRRPGSTRGSRTSASGSPSAPSWSAKSNHERLVRRLHVRQHDAGGGGLRPEQPAGELHAVDRLERSRPRNRRAPARGSSRALLARGEADEGKRSHGGDRRDRTSGEPVGARVMDPGSGYLPSFIRWWRVRFRSFLCFFFRIFLRRFLISDGKRSSLSVDSLGSEQVPEVDALGAVALLQTDGPQSKGLGRICHGRDQAQRAVLRHVLEVARCPCTRPCRRRAPRAAGPAARARTAAAGSA